MVKSPLAQSACFKAQAEGTYWFLFFWNDTRVQMVFFLQSEITWLKVCLEDMCLRVLF